MHQSNQPLTPGQLTTEQQLILRIKKTEVANMSEQELKDTLLQQVEDYFHQANQYKALLRGSLS